MVIVDAKLEEPIMSESIIMRTALLSQVNNNKNIIIIAPSGYGKTAFLKQIDQEDIVVWYQVDETDNLLITFFTYIMEGINKQIKGIKNQILEGFSLGERRDVTENSTDENILCDQLIGAIQKIDKRFLIKIDDYHWIKEEKIHRFIYRLLRYTPSNIRIIIASRIIPAINWNYLRDKLPIFITEDMLAFTEIEESRYLGDLNSEEETKNIREQNNGWPMGLSLYKHINKVHMKQTIDVLFKSVIESLATKWRECLIVGAYIEYITAELCNYSLNIDNAHYILDSLVEEGYYITKRSQAYRVHPLFKKYIKNEYRLEEPISAKMIQFFIKKEEYIRAIDQAFMVEKYEVVNEIMEQTKYKYISSSRMIDIFKWDFKINEALASEYYNLKLVHFRVLVLKEENISIKDMEWIREQLNGPLENKYAKSYLKLTYTYQLIRDKAFIKAEKIFLEILKSINQYHKAWVIDFIKLTYQILPHIWGEKEMIEKCFIEYFYQKETTKDKVVETIFLIEIKELLGCLGEKVVYKQIKEFLDQNDKEDYNQIQFIPYYMDKGAYSKAIMLAYKGISYYEKYGVYQLIPYLEFNIFMCEFLKGNYETALMNYREGKFIDREQDENKRFKMLVVYIRLLAHKGETKLALQILDEDPIIKKARATKWAYIEDTIRIEIYFLQADYKKIDFYEKHLVISKEMACTRHLLLRTKLIYCTSLIIRGKKEEASSLIEKIEEEELIFLEKELKDFKEKYKVFIYFILENYKKGLVYQIATSQKNALMEPKNKLKVKFFGDNIVYKDESYIKWRTLKARDIFYYLVYHSKEGVSKDKLLSVLWEDVDRDKGTTLLRTNITYIRKALKEMGIMENIIIYHNNRYNINREYIKDDLTKFTQLLNLSVVGELANRITAIEELYKLCKKDFCKDISIEEFMYIDRGMKDKVRSIAIELVQELLKTNNKDKITTPIKKILKDFL